MKVKTIVDFKFDHAYTGWNHLDFTDSDGNQVCVKMTVEDYLSLSDTLQTKAERIRKDLAEEAAEAARAAELAKEKENAE